MSAAIEVRRFDRPDDILDMKEAGAISIVRMGDGTTGLFATFEPGWTWEKDEKPLLGSPAACPSRHTGYCLAGKLVVRMIDTGTETPASRSAARTGAIVRMRARTMACRCCSHASGMDRVAQTRRVEWIVRLDIGLTSDGVCCFRYRSRASRGPQARAADNAPSG